MKQTSLLILAMMMVLALAACGGGTESAHTASESAALATGELDLPDTVDVNTVAEIMDRDDVVLIDVREQNEYDEAHIPGVTLIPLGTVPQNIDKIPTDKTVIITCRSGNRSGQATDFLRKNGYDNVHNMAGGINAWKSAGLDVE
ncbi:MAG: sulfurtransferase [Chloroflexi bacterium]|nr:MAG: sulfurtransferase [Chloroflexota bacterium]PIE82373.1 MAG: sulfurtransferase [Chloroflexota bacterium]